MHLVSLKTLFGTTLLAWALTCVGPTLAQGQTGSSGSRSDRGLKIRANRRALHSLRADRENMRARMAGVISKPSERQLDALLRADRVGFGELGSDGQPMRRTTYTEWHRRAQDRLLRAAGLRAQAREALLESGVLGVELETHEHVWRPIAQHARARVFLATKRGTTNHSLLGVEEPGSPAMFIHLMPASDSDSVAAWLIPGTPSYVEFNPPISRAAPMYELTIRADRARAIATQMEARLGAAGPFNTVTRNCAVLVGDVLRAGGFGPPFWTLSPRLLEVWFRAQGATATDRAALQLASPE